ncbi:MAG: ribose-5-phosphate isomerase RpiA [Candidatus Dormibacteria bacterium]
MNQIDPKQQAADRALEEVEDGMLLGLGTGSTARFFIEGVGRRVREEGLKLRAVATSAASAEQAAGLGISLLDSTPDVLDLTVDGADEIDPSLNLVKGLGGALLREKVVAAASARMVVIATGEKLVDHLGRGFLPVEILPLMWESTWRHVLALDLRPGLRESAPGKPFISDNGNLILDCLFTPPRDLVELACDLEAIPGVLGHGLFLGLAAMAVIAGPGGPRIVLPVGVP